MAASGGSVRLRLQDTNDSRKYAAEAIALLSVVIRVGFLQGGILSAQGLQGSSSMAASGSSVRVRDRTQRTAGSVPHYL
jgi:hypothetical protein